MRELRVLGNEGVAVVLYVESDNIGNRYSTLKYDILLHRSSEGWKIFRMNARRDGDQSHYVYRFFAQSNKIDIAMRKRGLSTNHWTLIAGAETALSQDSLSSRTRPWVLAASEHCAEVVAFPNTTVDHGLGMGYGCARVSISIF